MADFGGQINFSYGGVALTIRAKIRRKPGNFSYEAEYNQDGSLNRYAKVDGPEFECDFVDSADGIKVGGISWKDIMAGGPFVVNIIELTNGVTHQISAGSFIGNPDVDGLTGSVTGVTIRGPINSYKQIQS